MYRDDANMPQSWIPQISINAYLRSLYFQVLKDRLGGFITEICDFDFVANCQTNSYKEKKNQNLKRKSNSKKLLQVFLFLIMWTYLHYHWYLDL